MADGGNATGAIRVQVCYARPESQMLIDLEVPQDTTVEQAIRQSGVLDQASEIDLAQNKVGVFGRIKPLDARLRDGDRVEIYRPAVDPKEARRLRARRQASA